jgi:hypothetical protein
MDEDTITYSLNLYFIARWDETDNNQLEEQSAGILALTNIINRFNNHYLEVDISYPLIFTPFYQKFKDICTGVLSICLIEAVSDLVNSLIVKYFII